MSLSVREVSSSISGPVNSDTASSIARHRSDVSSELCCPGTKSQRCALSLVTRFDVVPRVGYNEFIFLVFCFAQTSRISCDNGSGSWGLNSLEGD